MRSARFPWWAYATLLVLILLFGLAPLVGVVAAEAIASANGCTLNEGAASVCVVGGSDWGGALYSMFVLTWFLLATLPLAGGALIVWLVILIIHRIAFARRHKSEPA
jgi:Na+-transporting methylmalonyl-CoA/oxaloacetate decarboxylase beta subunit